MLLGRPTTGPYFSRCATVVSSSLQPGRFHWSISTGHAGLVEEMAKKRKPARQETRPSRKPVFASPFKHLKKLIEEHKHSVPYKAPSKAAAPAPPPEGPAPPPPDDAELLRQAFEGVRPIADSRPVRRPVDLQATRAIVSEDAEAMAQLYDLVSGRAPFDITETEEYVEGARVGLDPRLLTRLRKAEFAVQAHLDLHGMVLEAAKQALTAFVLGAVQKGLRTVLIVHGRGRGSPGGRPVLKHAVVTWLSQRALAGYVLAFASARLADGGAGAMYVLLRRQRKRAPFEVFEGAKRRD